MNTSTFNTMDLSVTGDLTSPDHKTIEWENWGEERTVELYEVQIRFDGSQLGKPLTFIIWAVSNMTLGLALNQITTLECQPLFLSSLTFICTPPSLNPVPPAEAMMSPSQPKLNPQDKGRIGLVTSYINFHDCGSFTKFYDLANSDRGVLTIFLVDANSPTSTLTLHSIALRPVSNRPVWVG